MWAEQNLLRTLGKGSIQIGDEGHLNLCDKGKTWTNSRDTEGVGCARPSDSQENQSQGVHCYGLKHVLCVSQASDCYDKYLRDSRGRDLLWLRDLEI